MSADHDSPPLLPEPQTPAWLTGIGAFLFFLAGVWWLTTVSADQRKAGQDRAAATASAQPAAAQPAAPAQPAH